MFAQAMQMSLRKNRPYAALDFEGREVTYGELDAMANRVVRGLGRRCAQLGGPDGLHVGILMQNCPEWVASYLGISKAGAVVLPLNIHLTSPELTLVLQASGCRMLLYDPPSAALAEEACRMAGIPAWDVTSQAIAAESDASVSLPAPDLSRVVAMPFTSGTTGVPRGVVLTAGNLLASMVNAISAFGFVPGLANLVNKPLFFHPVTVGHILSSLWVGGKVVLHRRFSVDDLIAEVVAGRVGFVSHVPTTLHRQLAAMGDLRPGSRVNYFVGAAPLHEHVLKEAIERLGAVVQGWGMNECTNIITCTNVADRGLGNGTARWERMLSCGHPLPNSEVNVLTEAGAIVPLREGVVGEALVRGPITASGYWNSPEESARTFRDGWVYTGDIVEGIEGGCLRVIGRRKELIISGGMKIAPAEVEAVIQLHPSVQDVAVLGTAELEWGEVVTAAVVLKPGLQATAADIETHCRARLASFKCPRRIAFVSDLPRNTSSKVVKGELRRQLEAVFGQEH